MIPLSAELGALIGRVLRGAIASFGAGDIGTLFEAEQLDLRRSVALTVLLDV